MFILLHRHTTDKLGSPFDGLIDRKGYYSGIKTLESFIMPFVEKTLTLSAEELEEIGKSDQHFTFLHGLGTTSRFYFPPIPACPGRVDYAAHCSIAWPTLPSRACCIYWKSNTDIESRVANFTRDPKVIRDQIMAVLLAGRDTTAGTLSWAFCTHCPFLAH